MPKTRPNWLTLARSVPATAYLYGLLAVALLSMYAGFVHYQREIGRREIMLSAAASELRDAKMLADSLAKVYRVDTLRFTKIRRVTDSLTVTVDRWKTDTLKVVEYVIKADSTIKACSQALATCEQRVGAVTRALAASERANGILKAQMPSKLAPWRHRAEGAILGAAVYAIAGRIK
jgi:hypothetical protein